MPSASTVLVTGGAGMIGSNLVRRLAARGTRVRVVDNLWRGRLANLRDDDGGWVIDMDRDFFERDLSLDGSLDECLEGVDVVYHLADVVAGVGFVFSRQGEIFRQNVLINSNVVAAARRHRPSAFVYAGTACSFPAHLQTGVDAAPLREGDLFPASPESGYGWSKLMGHYEASLLEEEAGIPVGSVVLHNVYGAPCDYEEPRAQVIPSLIRKAVRHPAEPFVVWGTGTQGRAFLHVDDAVDGLVACAESGLGRGPIQIGPDTCTSIAEVARTVVEISGKDIEIEYDASRPEGDRGRRADYGKAAEILGWRPRTSLRDGLAALYGWVSADIERGAGPETGKALPPTSPRPASRGGDAPRALAPE